MGADAASSKPLAFFRPYSLYRLSSFQSFTTPHLASNGLLFRNSSDSFGKAAASRRLFRLCVYTFETKSLFGGNSCFFVFLAMHALSAHSTT